MKRAFVLGAGLGTRLKPWTDTHPKALVPVGGEPMLKRILDRLAQNGFESAVINVHHFADQIEEFVDRYGDTSSHPLEISFSDEREELLETGGGLLKASPKLFSEGCEDVLVHNADILSDAALDALYDEHLRRSNDVTLLVSDRDSSRCLWFDRDGRLEGWENLKTHLFKPEGYVPGLDSTAHAFSGIYVVNRRVAELMHEKGYAGKFPIMDFLLDNVSELNIRCVVAPGLHLLDIGKPETLATANATLTQ